MWTQTSVARICSHIHLLRLQESLVVSCLRHSLHPVAKQTATSQAPSHWHSNSSPADLESSTSMDDGFDKNSQVCSSFSRFVPFQAHAKTSRTWIIQGDLEGELLSCFQRECIAVRFSFLLMYTWKEGREESRLVFTLKWANTEATGQTHWLDL